MEKELKSYTDVLLRADLTGPGMTISANKLIFAKRVGWLCPVNSAREHCLVFSDSALKRRPVLDFRESLSKFS